MSSSHDQHHAPERPEVTNPLLWTVGMLAIIAVLAWWFANWMNVGGIAARKHGPIPLPQAAVGEPDHLALIAKRDQSVVDEGAVLYGKNCAACHGANGDANPTNANPAPRNLRTEGWKNPKGGGPYGLYTVMSSGYGGSMPSFPALSPEQRYSVVHFIRETMVKPYNTANYIENDDEAIVKQIPPPGGGDAPAAHGGDEEESEHARPDHLAITQPILPLMAGTAHEAESERQRLQHWLNAARHDATPEVAASIDHLSPLAECQPGLLAALHKAVLSDQKDVFTRLLANSDGAGSLRPDTNLMPAAKITDLYARLRSVENAP